MRMGHSIAILRIVNETNAFTVIIILYVEESGQKYGEWLWRTKGS